MCQCEHSHTQLVPEVSFPPVCKHPRLQGLRPCKLSLCLIKERLCPRVRGQTTLPSPDRKPRISQLKVTSIRKELPQSGFCSLLQIQAWHLLPSLSRFLARLGSDLSREAEEGVASHSWCLLTYRGAFPWRQAVNYNQMVIRPPSPLFLPNLSQF